MKALSAASCASSASVGREIDDLVGALRVGGGREHAADRVDLARGRCAGRSIVGLSSVSKIVSAAALADEHGAIERFGERNRVEDPDHGEPLVHRS